MGTLSYGVFTFPVELVAQTIKLERRRLCGIIVELRVVGKKLPERRRLLECMSAVLPPVTFLGNI